MDIAAARSYLEGRAESASQHALPSVRPLMTGNANGDPEPAGTCVLLWHRGKRYLVSAAHVFDSFLSGPLLVGTHSRWHEISGQFRSTNPPAGSRRIDDPVDFGFMEVSDSDAVALDGCAFLRADQVLLREQPTFISPQRSKYLAMGFPLHMFNYSWKHNATSPKVRRIMGAIAQLDLFQQHKRRPETHLLLELEAKGVIDPNGVRRRVPKMAGLSGGAILTVPGLTRIGDAAPAQLVGITTDYWAERDLFVGIRIDVVVAAIDAAA